MSRLRTLLLGAVASVALLGGVGAQAATLSYSFLPIDTFSGTPPAGSITAKFTDVAGGVQLTITSDLAVGESVDPGKGFYFNLNPADNATNLLFSLQTDTGGTTGAATVSLGTNAFKPDGDGLMDIELTWGPAVKAFQKGETETYLITGIAGLKAADFNFLSNCGQGCGSGAHLAAVHVQNTPSGGSGSAWVGASIDPTPVPEPASLVLFGLGLAGIGAVVARQRRRV